MRFLYFMVFFLGTPMHSESAMVPSYDVSLQEVNLKQKFWTPDLSAENRPF